MFKLESGLEKTKLFSNFLLVLLVAGNIFFSIQYSENIKQQALDKEVKEQESAQVAKRIEISRFLRQFIDTVLNTKEAISYEQRVKLESDVQQIKDADIIKLWNAFVNSKDSKSAQENTVKLMSMLANKML